MQEERVRAAPGSLPARAVAWIRAQIHGPDFVLMLIVLAGCALAYYLTTQFEEIASALSESTPPTTFPRLLVWTIGVLALLLPFEHRFHAQGKTHLDEGRRHRIKPIAVATAVLLVITVASMPWLGMVLAMVFVCVALPLLWGERRLRLIASFAVVFPAVVWLLFAKALKVVFEPGVFAGLFS